MFLSMDEAAVLNIDGILDSVLHMQSRTCLGRDYERIWTVHFDKQNFRLRTASLDDIEEKITCYCAAMYK